MIKCLMNGRWLRNAGILASALLVITPVSIWATPALTETPPVTIARETDPIKSAMMKLKKSNQRWIEVDLTKQRLIAWQGKTPFRAVIVSTGKAATPTLTGVFQIQSKLRLARMQGDDYDLPDVPFTMYYSGGYAIHGAYWHRSFGTPVSHGCVNVAIDHAKMLFDWASIGTAIVVHN
ncbi:MAG: L,D-transpeptidase [Phormidesmis sp. CAN_BIN44]|nr:L,D-transpeptidase [Phormidesmis sp. CAN_BIN44]